MSAIGPGNLSALPLASSISGVQRSDPDRNESRAEAADRTRQADQLALSSRAMDDVAETGLSPDRDADGHLAYQPPDEQSPKEDDEADQQRRRGMSDEIDDQDAEQLGLGDHGAPLRETGRHLDLEA